MLGLVQTCPAFRADQQVFFKLPNFGIRHCPNGVTLKIVVGGVIHDFTVPYFPEK